MPGKAAAIDERAGILLTGATGFLGGDLLVRLLQARPEATVYCLVRARKPEYLERRRAAILDRAGVQPADQARVVAVVGNVERPDLGLGDGYDALATRVDEVYHTAASTKFDLALEDARRVNRDGSGHVLAFARRATESGGLRRLHHVSTAYVAGDRAGVILEDEASSPFRNTYEQTKWEAEELLLQASADLPVTRYRPSIIVGDSRTGRTLHFRVLYDPMKWVYFGKTDVLPCQPDVNLDVVPVDYVCDALVAIGAREDSSGRVYHLTAGPGRTIPIEEMIELAVAEGNRYHREIGGPPIATPTIVSPDLAEAASDEQGEKLQQLYALGQAVMRSHVPYMLTEQLFDSTRTAGALEGTGIACPHLREYFTTLVRWGVERGFGES